MEKTTTPNTKWLDDIAKIDDTRYTKTKIKVTTYKLLKDEK